MKNVLFSMMMVVLIILSAGCISTSDETLSITNSDGTTTDISGEAERIVLLNSNAGEILYLLGDADKVVGISQSIKNNAEQAKLYPNAQVIGAWNEPDVEYLISLDVDLVIGYATSKPKNAEVLAATNIPVVYIDCTKHQTMESDIIEVGKIVGKQKEAEEIAEYYASVMEQVEAAAKLQPEHPTVYAESYTAWYGQGTDTGMGQLITQTAGQNIMTDTGSKKLSDEWVVTENPEIIIKLVNSMDTAEEALTELKERRGFNRISAVEDGNIWLIRNGLTYGPRACVAAVALFQMEYPDAEFSLTAKGVLEEFNEKFGTDFDTKNITYPAL